MCTLRSLQSPLDTSYNQSFKVLLKLIEMAFDQRSECALAAIEELLNQSFDVTVSFINTIDAQKFNDLWILIKGKSLEIDSKDRDAVNFEMILFSTIFERVILSNNSTQNRMEWMLSRNDWNEWIFRDSSIFAIVLLKIPRFAEEYRRYHVNIQTPMDLLWTIMLSADGKSNKECVIRYCKYIRKDDTLMSSFDEISLMSTIVHADKTVFVCKVKQIYLSILFYYFVDRKKALNYEKCIITTIFQKCHQMDLKKIRDELKIPKIIRNIIGDLMLCFEENKFDTDIYEYLNEHQNVLIPWFKDTKTQYIDSEGLQTAMDLVQLIIKLANKCIIVCRIKGIKSAISELHGNVIIGMASKLFHFREKIGKTKGGSQTKEHFFYYYASHQLKVYIYEILQTQNNSYFNTTKNTINVHVIFMQIWLSSTNGRKDENKEEEEKESEIERIANIHLSNICIPDKMKPKQICEFMVKNLQVRYDHLGVLPYKYDPNNLVQYESMSYKVWNYKKNKWNKIGHDHSLNKNKIATILLISEDEHIETPYHILLSHIHRYSLMSLREHDNVYYYKDDMWLKGIVKDIHPNTDVQGSHDRSVSIKCIDPKSKLFSKKNDDDHLVWEIFNPKMPTFANIIPSKLVKWFPSKYLASGNGKRQKPENWQEPQFCFISSFAMGMKKQLYVGWIDNINENEQNFHGAIETFSGSTPYPFHEKIVGRKLEIGSKILSLKNFVKQHFSKMNNNVNVREQHSWSRYVRFDAGCMHSFLVKDLQNVQVIEGSRFTMYFITAQHIEAMKKMNQSINYDILRYCRDSMIEKESFVLTVFEGFDRYSSILTDRFGAVFSENLDKMCPQNEVYTKCTYAYKQKKKEKKKNKKKKKENNAMPPHEEKKREPYSKQKSKNQFKKEKESLVKNWPKAMDVILKWSKKNANSPPTTTAAWENVIKNEIIRDLYPNFQGDGDIERLAIRASEIDFRKFLPAEEAPVAKPAKAKSLPPKKQNNKKVCLFRNFSFASQFFLHSRNVTQCLRLFASIIRIKIRIEIRIIR